MAEFPEAAVELLSSEIGLPNATIFSVLQSCDDAKLFLKDVSEYMSREKTGREKLRANIQTLRRARVNAGK